MKLTKIVAASIVIAGAVPLTAQAAAQNSYGLGVEYFHDQYKEPDLGVTDTTNYGSITGYFSHPLSKRAFLAIDGRVSHGKDDYDSSSGSLSGVPQWEYELRARLGYSFDALGGTLSPYFGLGARYFVDEGKGYTTDLGAQAYDRRIFQPYVPIGASLAYATDNGWSITPQAEADLIFYGNVDSRLTNIVSPDYQFLDPANNHQPWGLGLRSELMFGKDIGGYTMQLGPFVRYWYVPKSDTVTYENVNTGQPALDVYEPKNNRTQVGVALRMLW